MTTKDLTPTEIERGWKLLNAYMNDSSTKAVLCPPSSVHKKHRFYFVDWGGLNSIWAKCWKQLTERVNKYEHPVLGSKHFESKMFHDAKNDYHYAVDHDQLPTAFRACVLAVKLVKGADKMYYDRMKKAVKSMDK